MKGSYKPTTTHTLSAGELPSPQATCNPHHTVEALGPSPYPFTHPTQYIPPFLLWQSMICIVGCAFTLAGKQITSLADYPAGRASQTPSSSSRHGRLFQDHTGRYSHTCIVDDAGRKGIRGMGTFPSILTWSSVPGPFPGSVVL